MVCFVFLTAKIFELLNISLKKNDAELKLRNGNVRVNYCLRSQHFLLVLKFWQTMFTARGLSLAYTQMQGNIMTSTHHDKNLYNIIIGKKLHILVMEITELIHTHTHTHISIYLCRYFTCSKTMPGSLGHEEQDAKTFASWVS